MDSTDIVHGNTDRQTGTGQTEIEQVTPEEITEEDPRPQISGRPQTINKLSTPPQNAKLNWVQITMMNRPDMTKTVPKQLIEKITKSRQLLMEGKIKPVYEPKPVALYFKNVRRGLLELIRSSLRECLLSWAILGLDFNGTSVLEISLDERLKDRTVATLKMIGIMVIQNFDILAAAASKSKSGELPDELAKIHLGTAVHRLEKRKQSPK